MIQDTDAVQSTPRRADFALWAEARELYVAGLSPRLIAGRLGLGERNIRRRAAEEGWARLVRTHGHEARRALALDADPVLQALADDHEREVDELLSHPDALGLRRFAFRRATEAAVTGSPLECAAWLRVVDALRRNGDVMDADDQAFEPADMRRSAYLYEVVAADLEDRAAQASETAGMSSRQDADIPDIETKAWRPPHRRAALLSFAA